MRTFRVRGKQNLSSITDTIRRTTMLPANRKALLDTNSNTYGAALMLCGTDLVGRKGTLKHIRIAPVKSLGMLELPEALVTPAGLTTTDKLVPDRGMMLAHLGPGKAGGVTYDATMFSQRDSALLALVNVTYDRVEHLLTYTAPGMKPLNVHTNAFGENGGRELSVRMFKDDDLVLRCARQENDVVRWVRAFLEGQKWDGIAENVVLVLPAKNEKRPVLGDDHRLGHDPFTLLSDGDQVHLISEDTRLWMTRYLRGEHGEDFRDIPSTVFRAGLVIEGLGANAEDVVRRIEFDGPDGPVPLVLTCYCKRCSVIQVDPEFGDRLDKEPLAWLAKHRPRKGPKVTFGWNALFPKEAHGRTLKAGATFTVIEEQ